MSRRNSVILAWLLCLVLSVLVIARTPFSSDLSAFLPASPTKEQKVLLDQLQAGVVSRLILIGIEGADSQKRAAISKDMAKRLRGDQSFVLVNNGEPVYAGNDREFLFKHRYLLSPAVTPEHFTAQGMHAAMSDSIDMLASPAGLLMKSLLPRDPTGEMMRLIEQMNGGNRPQMLDGVWSSRDNARAILLAQTHAAGSDTDGQQLAMTKIRQAFDAARKQQGLQQNDVALVMTGPGVFSVLSRQTIESEVTRLSIISVFIIVTLLLIVYRSFTALALGLLPVVSGAIVGVVAVSLGFGLVHGITLGFGTTLIGEAVDYSIYLFVQSRQTSSPDQSPQHWITEFWPTIRLGVLTSIMGFSSLLLSGFPGLAQLGLYSTAGLLAAALVTRYVLPYLLPKNFRIRDVSAIGMRLAKVAQYAPRLRWPFALAVICACVLIFQHRDSLWNTELSSLSPVSKADQMIDAKLRADMGAPDVRHLVVVSASDREAVLESAGKIAQQLQPLVDQGALAAFESPTRYLPSLATQRARQASLPSGDLKKTIQQAIQDLPVRADIFAPFIADITASKSGPLLRRESLDGTSLSLAVDSLLFSRDGRWTAILPLTAPVAGENIATEPIKAAIQAAGQQNALFVDLKLESDRLYSGYLHEASWLSLGGFIGIVLLLAWVLRSPWKIAQVLFPLVAAVVIVIAFLILGGQRLTILHLIGLLLIVAVGSNYALFFAGAKSKASLSPQTLTSLVFANLTTVAGFGLLGFSKVPFLNAIGMTVGPGAVLALVLAATFGMQGQKAVDKVG